MSALRSLFSEVRGHKETALVCLVRTQRLLDFEITFSKSSKAEIEILHVFRNGMPLFWCNQGERIEQFEHGSLVRQKKAVKRMLRFLSVQIQTSALAQSRYADTQTSGLLRKREL